MKTNYTAKGLGIAVFAFTVIASTAMFTGCQFSTANIPQAVMATDVNPETFEPIETTESYKKYTQVLHCAVQLANAPSATNVKAVWQWTDPETGDIVPMDSTDIDMESDGWVDFTYGAPPTGFRYGEYTVKIYLNGSHDQDVNFTIDPTYEQGPLSEIVMATRVNDARFPLDPGFVLPTGLQKVYCIAYKRATTEPVILEARWFQQLESGMADIAAAEVSVEEQSWIEFSLTLTNPLPLGQYAVEIYADGELFDTIDFAVADQPM
ncbi:MAG: hypothetical protein CL946_03035 [Ectothiorhodospiraceae bacterium]|nr:hypothetical protein [Ectothiorhodospiraceae bacterium]